MHYFSFKKNNLYCENIKVQDLVDEFGTPLYIYSEKTILEHFIKLRNAFSKLKPLICYSVKANSNLSVLNLLTSAGAGLDIVSGGELYRAKKVKCQPGKIVYASVGKTDREIKDAIKYGIFMFNIESIPELERIAVIAKKLKKKVRVALRFNPDVEPGTHAYITTGKKETKFGMDIQTVERIFLNRNNYPYLKVEGLHMHIGSQITKAEPFIKALRKAKKLLSDLEKENIKLKYLNIGGGLGIVYDKEKPQTAKEFASKIIPLISGLKLKLVLEPGRFIMGNAGILATKVIYIKKTPKKRFVVVDAAMNDLARPSLYEAYHKIVPATKTKAKKDKRLADVVGPICESADFLGKSRKLDVDEGQVIAIMGTGAYGFSMSSNYNSRPRTAEVLVKNKKARLIRKRENYKDLVAKEIIT